MLEDRKFFDHVGAEASPWRVVGPAEALSRVTADAYVGEHTPQIKLNGSGVPQGIAQSGLGLVKGKTYEGRVVLASAEGAPKVTVTLSWGPGESDRQTVSIDGLTTAYAKYPIAFTAGADSDDAVLTIAASGGGAFLIGTVSLMPSDNVHGMRPDTLALL
jgi:alpha-N-arabinofuranosidase